jgi:hypothetical protein
MIAALFVQRGGSYWNLPDVDPWDESRDARLYPGPHPVVAHPPCERWGRYWHGGPSAKVRRVKGDDGGCFAAALAAVRKWGGGGWVKADADILPRPAAGWFGWTCCVEQGHYGHRARKATWLYTVGCEPPSLRWGRSSGDRLDEGFHSAEERRAARAAGMKPRRRLSSEENLSTPIAFRDVLLDIARSVNAAREAA